MIRSTVHNLRTSDWARVDRRELLERIKDEHFGGEAVWTMTPWTRHDRQNRSYLLHSSDGALYAIFLRKVS